MNVKKVTTDVRDAVEVAAEGTMLLAEAERVDISEVFEDKFFDIKVKQSGNLSFFRVTVTKLKVTNEQG